MYIFSSYKYTFSIVLNYSSLSTSIKRGGLWVCVCVGYVSLFTYKYNLYKCVDTRTFLYMFFARRRLRLCVCVCVFNKYSLLATC